METKTYTNKSNAIRAARAALTTKHPGGPLSGVHFNVRQLNDEEWVWDEVNVDTGEVTAGSGEVPPPPPSLPEVTPEPSERELAAKAQRQAAKAAKVKAAPAGKAKPPLDPAFTAAAKPSRQRQADSKPAPAAKAPGAKHAAALEAAKAGTMPEAPVFGSASGAPYQRRLDKIVAAANAGDVAALKAFNISDQVVNTRIQQMARYRDLVVVALEAKAAK